MRSQQVALLFTDDLDLATLTGDLQRVTASTVQPAATGIWLRSRGQP